MKPPDDPMALAEEGVELSLSLGADEAEVFLWVASKDAARRSGSEGSAWSADHSGTTVRLNRDGRRASATTSGTRERDVEWAIRTALEEAPLIPPFEGPGGLVDRAGGSRKDTWVHEEVTDPDPQRLLDTVDQVAEIIESATDIDYAKTGVSASTGRFFVANSHGVRASDVNAYEVLPVEARSQSTRGRRTVKLNPAGRTPTTERLDLEALAENVVECTRLDRKPETIDQPVEEVIFDAEAASRLFSGLLPSLAGFGASSGRSHFADRIDEPVLSDKITLRDRPADRTGCRNQAIDDEGIPTSEQLLVEEGVLRSFVYSWTSAQTFELEPTGNGLRPVTGRYSGGVQDRLVNPQIEPGTWTLEEMIDEAQDAVLVTGAMLGGFLMNHVTGDFSLVATAADRVRDGRTRTPLRPVTVGGNLFDLFQQIRGLGTRLEQGTGGASAALWVEGGVSCAN